MSWLVDLAGKAESLLEKVDQTAANALHVDKGVGSDLTSSNGMQLPVVPMHRGLKKVLEETMTTPQLQRGLGKAM